MAKKLTSTKARKILHDKSVHGHPLTEKQRKFFGAIAGGAKPYKAQIGTMLTSLPSNWGDRLSDVLAFPQKAITKLFTGEYQTPSEAMGIKNKVGAFATDVVLDPINLLLGAGSTKTAGALDNVYRLNPWAFKASPEAYYRGIGRTGLDDALESGVLRPPVGSKFGDDLYLAENLKLAEGFSQNYAPFTIDKEGNVIRGLVPKGFDPKRYIAEIPKNIVDPVLKNERTRIFTTTEKIPINDIKLYKQHWLKGYKEVPKSKKKQNGGWLDKYDAPQAQTGTEVIKGKDFVDQWMKSPMYKEMLEKSAQGPELERISKGRIASFNVPTNVSRDINLEGTGTLGQTQHRVRTMLNATGPEYEEMMKIMQKSIDNPKDKEAKRRVDEVIQPMITGWNIGLNPKLKPGTIDYEATLAHEYGHTTDNPFVSKFPYQMSRKEAINLDTQTYIPKSDIEKMKAYSQGKVNDDLTKYVSKPQETRQYLNDIRYLGKSQGVYDPFSEKITTEQFKKIQPLQYGNPMQTLRQVYTDEQIIDMLNSISKTQRANDIPVAQNGIEGTMGGLTDVGFNYNGAWGGPSMQMGGVLPGAVGFTYARTQSPAPSNGPYAKKTKASAQNGQEMKYYQEGLDFKPKTISQDGSAITTDINDYRRWQDSATLYNQSKAVQDYYRSKGYRVKPSSSAPPSNYIQIANQEMSDLARRFNETFRNFKDDPSEKNIPFLIDPSGNTYYRGASSNFIERAVTDNAFWGKEPYKKEFLRMYNKLKTVPKGYTGTLDMFNSAFMDTGVPVQYLHPSIRPTVTLSVEGTGPRKGNYDEIFTYDLNAIRPRRQKVEYTPDKPLQPIPPSKKQTSKTIGPFPIIETPRRGKYVPIPREAIDLGYELPTPKSFVAPKAPEQTPTKYTFTYPTGKYNEQKTMYFPSKAALKSFVGGIRDATYQEGKDYASATGTLQDGGDIPVDPMGYWNPENVGSPVTIPSNVITMEGVDQPLLGISDTGDVQYMMPGEDYEFDGEYVTEYPVAQGGKRVPITVSDPKDPRLKAYQDSLSLSNYSTLQANKYFGQPNPDKYNSYDQREAIARMRFDRSMYNSLANSISDIYGNKISNLQKRTGYLPIGIRYLGEGSNFIFKKPVQPVEYRKPEPKQEVVKKPEPVVEKKAPLTDYFQGTSVFAPTPYHGSGAGAFVGYRTPQGDTVFVKPEDYERMAVPKYGREFIESKKKMKNGGVSVNNADAQPLKKLDQLLNFTNYNKPTKGGWLDKYK